MKVLADTHALLWWLFDDPALSATARGLFTDPDNDVFVSAASAWEIATKHRIGKLDAAAQLVQDMPGWVEKAGFSELPIRSSHAQRAGTWPQAHRDPFDRMLAAQSVLEDLPIVGRDAALEIFGVRLIW